MLPTISENEQTKSGKITTFFSNQESVQILPGIDTNKLTQISNPISTELSKRDFNE